MASVVAATLLLVSVRAAGQGSIYEIPPEPTLEQQNSFESFAEEVLAEESLFAPAIDITAEGIVSGVPRTAWSAGADLVVFHPSFGIVDFSENGDDVYSVTPRLFVGWEGESGFGVRSRLWGFEAEGHTDASIIPLGGFSTLRGLDFRSQFGTLTGSTNPFELRAGSLDLDFYKRFGEGKTSLVLGAGPKAAAFQFEHSLASESLFADMEDTVSGIGAGIFTDLRHVLYQSDHSEIALVGSGRTNFLVGKSRHRTTTTFGPDAFIFTPGEGVRQVTTHSATEVRYTEMTISEAALGLEWKRDFGWSVLTLRGQYETQFWNTDIRDDLSFNGGAVRAGLSW